MKALTVRQPWASLIALGYKQMETRTRDTKHRGWLAIHAGLAMPCRIGQVIELDDFTVERDKSGLLLRAPFLSWPYRLPQGAVVAVVDLFQTHRTDSTQHKPSPRERSLGMHEPGMWAWSLSSVSPITPVPAVGSLGLWDWEPTERAVSELRYPLGGAS